MSKHKSHGTRVYGLRELRVIRIGDLDEGTQLAFAKWLGNRPRPNNKLLAEYGWWDAVDLDLWEEFNGLP